MHLDTCRHFALYRILHDRGIARLVQTFREAPAVSGKPTLILAVKGKGVSFAENIPAWHHHVPSVEQLAVALAELSAVIDQLRNEGMVQE